MQSMDDLIRMLVESGEPDEAEAPEGEDEQAVESIDSPDLDQSAAWLRELLAYLEGGAEPERVPEVPPRKRKARTVRPRKRMDARDRAMLELAGEYLKCVSLGQPRKALKQLKQMEKLLADSPDLLVQCLACEAEIMFALGWHRKAFETLQREGTIYGDMGRLSEFAASLVLRGHGLLENGMDEKSLEVFCWAEELAKLLGDRTCQAHALGGIGMSLVSMGLFPKALHAFNKAEDLLRETDEGALLATNKVNQALALYFLGEIKLALAALSEAEQLGVQLNDPRVQAYVLANRAGILACEPSRRREARKSLRKAVALIDQIDDEEAVEDLQALIDAIPKL